MPDAAWESNTTVEALAAWLRGARRVIVLTHAKPDGDAVGSTLAAARALNIACTPREAGGIAAIPWYAGPMPDWFCDVAKGTPTLVMEKAGPPAHEDPDAVLILDTGSWSQLHETADWLRRRHEEAAVIDHHRQGDGDAAPRRLIVPEAAAVCEVVAELCRLLLGMSRVEELPTEIAEALYLGLAADTGWFRHSNVTPAAMRLAGALLEAGVDHARLFAAVEQRDRSSRLRLMARALASLELLDKERVAVMVLTQQDFHDCKAAPTDSGGFTDLPLSVGTVQVSAVLTEAFVAPGGETITKVSLRSKTGPGSVDVNAAARRLGGGGHLRAGGAKMAMPLAEAKKRVLEVLM